MLKLNLGSGPNGIDGWLNYDWGLLPLVNKFGLIDIFIGLRLIPADYKVGWPKFDLVDIRKGLPLSNKSVDFIYCSHVLEHFEKFETLKVLTDCRRVLKKKGVLRVVLPDLKLMMKKYEGADKFCHDFFGFDKDKKLGMSGRFIRGHQWMYDTDSLKSVLLEAGFKEIVVCGFRTGQCPDLDKLDYEGHCGISMYIEAQ